MPQTKCPLTKIYPSVVKEVPAFGLSAWNIEQRIDKWNVLNKQNDKKNLNIIIKTFFPGMKSNQKCTTKLGESHQGNLSAESLSVSVKIKPLFWSCSCSLPIHRTPYLCMLLLEHCDTQLRLHLFQNINDNNYNNSHTRTHTHTFQTNVFIQKVWASWCLRAKSRSRTACDVEIIKR